MYHIHTFIVSRHLATRAITKYCAQPHHTLAALKRYFSASLVVPLPNSEQISHPSSNDTYTKSTPKHIHYHYAPFVTLTYTTHHHLFNCTHIRTTLSPLDLWTDPAGVTAQMDGEAGWWTTSGNIGLPPLARVKGVCRQQQEGRGIVLSSTFYMRMAQCMFFIYL